MQQLNIHTIMHVPFEGIGCIQNWIDKGQHRLTYTKIFEKVVFPEMDELDWLIVMGGPMSVYEENNYPWLKDEKIFIRKAIDAGKTVIGICLGSQFIADVLGAKVYPNNIKEIGWLNVTKAAEHEITRNFPETFSVFQWHGDTFDIPEKAVKLFRSEVCSNQAFIYDNRVLALQFHYEATAESINEMLIHGADELIPAATVQSAQEIRENIHLTTGNNERMYEILDYLAKK